MADFWQGIGDFFSNPLDPGAAGRARSQQSAGQEAATAGAAAAGQLGSDQAAAGRGYDAGAAASMGANAGEYMAKQRAAAAQGAGDAATQASRKSMQAARTAGLNKGQAALAGAQQAGDVYSGGLERGMDRYAQGTQMFANQGNAKAGLGLQGAGLQGQIGVGQQGAGTQAMQANQQAGQGFWSGVGGLATAALGLSDRNAKEGIQQAQVIDRAALRIKPVRFRFKEGGGENVGVIAQDVEKVFPENVTETPAGKAIDLAKQTGTNTAMLMEAINRLRDLERRVK
jgi:hypothetical protein